MEAIKNQHTRSGESARFFGRRAIFAKIYSRIGARNPQSVSIVGYPKVGKSVLLKYLASDQTRFGYLPEPNGYILISIRLSELELTTPDIVYDAISEATFPHISAQVQSLPVLAPAHQRLHKLVEHIQLLRRNLIIFLDDFNLVTQNPAFTVEFYNFLRSLTINYNVAFVTTSPKELQQLSVYPEVSKSSFFNVFTNLFLKPLSQTESCQLISHQLMESGLAGSAHLEWIYRIAGPFPLLQKEMCRLLIHHGQLSNWQLGLRQFSIIESEFQQIADAYFTRIVDWLDPDQRKALQLTTDLGRLNSRHQYLLNNLERMGFIQLENDGLMFTSTALQTFLQANSTETHHPTMFRRFRKWLNQGVS